jgi:ribokinase
MVLSLGRDAYAHPLKASLHSAGVVLYAHEFECIATGTAFICVSDDAENAITVAPGANAHLGPAQLPALDGYSHLLMQLEIPMPTVLEYATRARAAGLQVALNAAPAQSLSPALLALVDILIVNEGELHALSRASGTIAQALAALPCALVVVTLGSRGAVARGHTSMVYQPGFAVTAIDTTGAGDTFCGVLVAKLSQQQTLADALRHASAAAALCCTQAGAQSSVPQTQAVESFLQAQAASDPQAIAALMEYCNLAT